MVLSYQPPPFQQLVRHLPGQRPSVFEPRHHLAPEARPSGNAVDEDDRKTLALLEPARVDAFYISRLEFRARLLLERVPP